MTDLSDLAIRHAATKVRAIRPGVEPQDAVAVIRALLAMGWAAPVHDAARSETTIEVVLADAQRTLTSAIEACTEMSRSFGDLVRTRDNLLRERDALVRRLAKRFDARTEATRLLKLALHLRQHGERAPGGTETWREFDREAEAFLRAEQDPGEGYSPVRVPENTGKHPAESGETSTKADEE